jgi:pimeloyl-ACP methyl ester carboxylesterase
MAEISEETFSSLASAAGIAYQRRGTGETLLLLHGLGESSAGWRPVLPVLAEHYDVIVADLPGFGASPALPSGVLPTAGALADALERALDELGVDKVHVAGYSLGARVALELGARGRARSVVVIASDGLGTPLERLHQASALVGRRFAAHALAPWTTSVAGSVLGRWLAFAPERLRPWLLSPVDARELLSSLASSPGYAASVTAGTVDVPAGLSGITCPVLILQGTNDPLVSVQAPRFLGLVPNARLRWLPGLSHIPISDDPGSIAKILLDFLADATAHSRQTT